MFHQYVLLTFIIIYLSCLVNDPCLYTFENNKNNHDHHDFVTYLEMHLCGSGLFSLNFYSKKRKWKTWFCSLRLAIVEWIENGSDVRENSLIFPQNFLQLHYFFVYFRKLGHLKLIINVWLYEDRLSDPVRINDPRCPDGTLWCLRILVNEV